MLSDSGLQMAAEWLLYDEGFEQFPYDDQTGKPVDAPVGIITIGIGFNLSQVGLTLRECLYILRNRITMLDDELSKKLPEYAPLDEPRRVALINMAYNLGIPGLMAFHDFLLYLYGKDYLNASKEVMDSKAAKELTHRYERLAETILTGKYPDVVSINRAHS